MSRTNFCAEVRGAVAGYLVDAQHGPGAVPVLAHRRLGPLDAPPAQFPIGVQPVRVADHDHQPVARVPVAVGHRLERQVFGGGQAGLDLLDAAFDAGVADLGSRLCGRLAVLGGAVALAVAIALMYPLGGFGPRPPRQRVDEFVLAHGVPAGDLLLAGHFRQVLDRAVLQLGYGNHGTYLRFTTVAAFVAARTGRWIGRLASSLTAVLLRHLLQVRPTRDAVAGGAAAAVPPQGFRGGVEASVSRSLPVAGTRLSSQAGQGTPILLIIIGRAIERNNPAVFLGHSGPGSCVLSSCVISCCDYSIDVSRTPGFLRCPPFRGGLRFDSCPRGLCRASRGAMCEETWFIRRKRPLGLTANTE